MDADKLRQYIEAAIDKAEAAKTKLLNMQEAAEHDVGPAAQVQTDKVRQWLQNVLTGQLAISLPPYKYEPPCDSAPTDPEGIDEEIERSERYSMVRPIFEARLKDLPIASLRKLKTEVVPPSAYPDEHEIIQGFSAGNLRSLIDDCVRGQHLRCRRAMAEEAVKRMQLISMLLPHWTDVLCINFQFHCALAASGSAADMDDLIVWLTGIKRDMERQDGESPRQVVLTDLLQEMANVCQPFSRRWAPSQKAFFEDYPPGTLAFVFEQITRPLFVEIYPSLLYRRGEAAKVFRDSYTEIIELLKSYPDGIPITSTPLPSGRKVRTVPPRQIKEFVCLCRRFALAEENEAQRKALVSQVKQAEVVEATEPPVVGEPLSKPMSKSDIMAILKIDGRKRFETWAEGKLVQVGTNRQLWQVRLNSCAPNERAKLEKA